ncbi:MAG TPA: anti-sigma F factor [Clostridiales bacterium]|nr:anti-sigma F factor [Clostridiales bacterium]
MMKNNEMHLTFPAMSENEALARMCASAFAAQLNPTIEEISDIRTAVSEAVTNSIIHGYNSKPLTIYLDAYISDNELKIVVRDEGKGIDDIDLAMTPFYTTLPDGERSGMGFSVMQAFMDELYVSSMPEMGTTVTMIKRIVRCEEE